MSADLPDTTINEVRSVVDDLFASAVLHSDFHKLLEDRIVTMVIVLEFVHVWLDVGWNFGHTNQ